MAELSACSKNVSSQGPLNSFGAESTSTRSTLSIRDSKICRGLSPHLSGKHFFPTVDEREFFSKHIYDACSSSVNSSVKPLTVSSVLKLGRDIGCSIYSLLSDVEGIEEKQLVELLHEFTDLYKNSFERCTGSYSNDRGFQGASVLLTELNKRLDQWKQWFEDRGVDKTFGSYFKESVSPNKISMEAVELDGLQRLRGAVEIIRHKKSVDGQKLNVLQDHGKRFTDTLTGKQLDEVEEYKHANGNRVKERKKLKELKELQKHCLDDKSGSTENNLEVLSVYKAKCHSCNCRFTDTKYLTVHEKYFHKKIFNCNYCTKTFPTHGPLRVHCELMHVGLPISSPGRKTPSLDDSTEAVTLKWSAMENDEAAISSLPGLCTTETETEYRKTVQELSKSDCSENDKDTGLLKLQRCIATSSSSLLPTAGVSSEADLNTDAEVHRNDEGKLTAADDVDTTTNDLEVSGSSNSISVPSTLQVTRTSNISGDAMVGPTTVDSSNGEETRENKVLEQKHAAADDRGIVTTRSSASGELIISVTTTNSSEAMKFSAEAGVSRELCKKPLDTTSTAVDETHGNDNRYHLVRSVSLPPYAVPPRYDDCRRRANSECDLNIYDLGSYDGQLTDFRGCGELVCSSAVCPSKERGAPVIDSVKSSCKTITSESSSVIVEAPADSCMKPENIVGTNAVSSRKREWSRVFLLESSNGEEDIFIEDDAVNGEVPCFSNMMYYFRLGRYPSDGVVCAEGKAVVVEDDVKILEEGSILRDRCSQRKESGKETKAGSRRRNGSRGEILSLSKKVSREQGVRKVGRRPRRRRRF